MKDNITIRMENKIIDEINRYIEIGIFRSKSQMISVIIRNWLEKNKAVHRQATCWRRQAMDTES